MVKWKAISDIVKRNKGISITAGQMNELNSSGGNIRVFAAGQTIADIDETKLPKGCAHLLIKTRCGHTLLMIYKFANLYISI